MEKPLKLLLVGLDGVNFDLLQRLLPREVLPTIWNLIETGASGELASVFPTHSAAAWASFMTGQTPGRHGVFDFKVRLPDGHYRHAKPDPQATVWHLLGQAGYRLGVFNFPITYPPDPVNGWVVSGMLSPDLHRFTYPAGLAAEITAAFPAYTLDVEWTLYEGREEAFIHDLVHMVRQRGAVARYLLAQHPVDIFAVAFIATDRAQHALWRYIDPLHPFFDPLAARALRPEIYRFYAELDQAVASLVALVGDETPVLLLSDHGFQAAAWQFHVDEWLKSMGWQARRATTNRIAHWLRRWDTARIRQLRRRIWPDISRHFPAFRPGGAIEWSRTLAFCPWNFHQGIRLNLRGREPFGIVAPGSEFERLRAEIGSAISALRYPEDGAPVISNLYPGEALCDGAHADQMPDLVFELNPNFAPGIHRPGLFEPTGWLSGDHNLKGFYALRATDMQPGSTRPARLIDMAPTILHLLGVHPTGTMTGSPLVSLFHGPAGHPAAVAAQAPASEFPQSSNLTPEEERKLLQQLRDLDYL